MRLGRTVVGYHVVGDEAGRDSLSECGGGAGRHPRDVQGQDDDAQRAREVFSREGVRTYIGETLWMDEKL